jgi:deoxyguanosine kinase
MGGKFITIEGNIGAGKTTLCQLLQRELGGQLILEQFAENPFLPKFYRDRSKYAFPLELSFLAERFKQLKEVLNTGDLFSEYTISDYLFIKSKLFARVNLTDDEYLHAPLSKLRKNITQRNRSYEQDIPDDYLLDLQNAYLQLIKSSKYRSLVIDTTQTDFLNNPSHLKQLIQALQGEYRPGWHYIQID